MASSPPEGSPTKSPARPHLEAVTQSRYERSFRAELGKLHGAMADEKKAASAQQAELEEKRLRGQLVEVEKVTEQADAAARAVRGAFLALPDRLASLLVGRTEKQISMELRKEIRQTLVNASIEVGRK